MTREIERNIISAIRYSKNVGVGNTCVCNHKNKTYVILHGNLVSEIDNKKHKVKLYDGGFQSNVTKSRLNATLTGVFLDYKVAKRNGTWYLLDGYGRIYKTFKNGMSLDF